MNEFEMNTLRGFIDENWQHFVDYCTSRGTDADEVYETLFPES